VLRKLYTATLNADDRQISHTAGFLYDLVSDPRQRAVDSSWPL
jgi:hypothetical protein